MLKLITSNLTSILTFTSIVLSLFVLKENFNEKSQEDFHIETQNQEAQNVSLVCSQTSAWEAAMDRNPSLKKEHQNWEAKMLQAQSNKSILPNLQPTSVPYELPVVVHIIHDNGPENISDALVQAGISDLNEAFANQGYYDKGIGADAQISFCLATQDPDGNITSGINRVQSPLTEMNEPVNDLDVKNLIRWDPLDYINIWVVKEICSGQDCATAGYAYFPSAHGTDIDGILIESLFFGTTQANSSVLVHEMGHYLGLYHTFQGGCSNNDCLNNGDRVCDTPPDQTAVPSPCASSINSCTSDVNTADPNNPFTTDQDDQSSNFMDYGYFQCLHSFTAGQGIRMQNAIATARSSLLNSPACQSACPTLITSSFDIPSAPINIGNTVTFNNTSTGGLYFDWTIDQVPFDGTYTFNTEGTFEITLVVTNDDPNCVASSTAVVTVICEAQAAFTVDATQAQINNIINFTDNSTNANNISWTVDGSVVNNTPNFQFFSSSVGNFTVCLIASNSICLSEVCQVISIVGNSSVLEICDNGFDDDGDGLIDCYDPDCCNTASCIDNYYQDCVDVTDCDTSSLNYDFSMIIEWSTPLTTKKAPIVNVTGDINNDGIPNILQGRRVTNKLDMLNGSDGSVVWTIDLEDAGNFSGSTLIADVDLDGTAEIFMTIPDKIFRVEHDGTISAEGTLPSNGGGWFKNYFITDFNEDGTPEIMHLNNIIDVTTLQVIASLPLTDYSVPYEYGTGVPLDVFPASPSCPDCDGLELVLGPFLFSLNPTTFEFTKIHEVAINDPFFSNQSTTAIADMDNDGDLDAVIEADEINTLYVWDIQTPTIMAKETDGVFPFSTTSHNRPAVADLDGDGLPEIICRNANDLVAYNGDLLTIDWTTPIQEFGGNATQSVFDINGDGLPEVIYRDNAFLRIINGQTGELLSSIPCQSGTGSELPVIADIDADGEAEIFCECNARAHVFGRGGNEPWANARKVWNQKQYYNTNINDDLTVPIIQQPVNLVGDGNIMNSFYQQTVVPNEPVACEEICDNGIDDDNDGLIDCFDPDCCESAACVDNYYQDCNVIDCDTTTNNDFAIQLEWSSPSSINRRPYQHMVGDLNNDGIPNVFQGRRTPGIIEMLNGTDGSLVWSINVEEGAGGILADVDMDGTAEYFAWGSEKVYRVEHDGTVSAEGPLTSEGTGGWFRNYFITDFNEDGTPELMLSKYIIDVNTMEVISTMPVTDFTYFYEYGTGVAVDVLPASPYCPDCDGLEFVLGPFLYSVHPTTFEFTQIHSVALNDPYYSTTSTLAIADMDKDGDLDGVISSNVLNGLYVWDIQTPTIIAKEEDGTFPFAFGGHNRPAVADLDGDGFPEIICRNGNDMVAYNGDLLSIDWVSPIEEFGGNATQSIFDINGDGFPEVIYRDNVSLKIISGQTGELLSSIPCSSGTSSELPVIADIDADGEAEIYCECSNRIHIFGSGGNKPWANARQVWHQKQYYNTNINDDLTVPAIQQQKHLVGDGNILNSFYQQAVIPNEPVDCGEICDNGIDDDGDGLIDCYDPDCCESAACVDNYYQDCVVEGCDTTVFDDFSIQLEWSTSSSTFLSPPGFDIIAGDIDNDGIPEVIQTSNVFGKFAITNGQDGSIISEFTQYDIQRPVIGDVDSDGTAEFFFGGGELRRMEHDGTITGMLTMPTTAGGWLHTRQTLQDFNQDGKPELMRLNYIIDTETLEILSTLPVTDYDYFSDYGLGVAVDVMSASSLCPDCDGLEYVVGPFLYSVHPTTFEFTQIHSVNVNAPFQPGTENTTSIADIDKDGDLDAVVRAVGMPLYVWDIQTPTIMYNEEDGSFSFTPSSHNMPAIADLDGDGFPEIIARNGLSELVAYNHDLSSADWVAPISDNPGGNATQSIFDINEDGFPEVIYRDAGTLRIINGQTGELLSSFPCSSGTNSEMPAILDVDADGEAEIVCECNNRVHVFGSAGANPWANTRKVWNQFLNFNVHINDDLTIPQEQQKHHLVGDGNVMNSFLQQMVIPQQLADCPEICDNGIDDDNDGLIDCEDDDCCQDVACNNQPTPCDPPCVFVGNVDLGPDVQVCDNGIINFDAGSGFSSYLWSDQSSDQTFTATGTGTIWVIATDSCGNNYTDSVTISLIPQTDVNLGADISLCSGDSTIISGGTFDTYQWYKDDVLVCDGCAEIMVTPIVAEEYVLLAGTNQGCFSIDTINIFLDTIAVGYETRYVCEGDTIDVFGQPVFDNQVLEIQLGATGACDSILNITVELQENKINNQVINICEGETVNVFGENVSSNTILQQDNTTTFGCDSIQIVEVVVSDIIETSNSFFLCSGDSVVILNQTIYADTTIIESLTGSNNCDSVHTYSVLFGSVVQTEESISICEGDTVIVFGQPIFEENTLNQIFTSSNNCDSTHTVNVLLQNIFETDENITICEGDTILISNQNIFSDTTIIESLSAVNGCDSVHTYFVSINNTIQTQETISICDGDTAIVFGQIVFESNSLSQTFTGANNCDSIHTINVLFQNIFETNETIVGCIGESISIGNQTIFSDTTIIESLSAVNGCDSIHTYFISFNNIIQTQETRYVCEGDTIIVFGQPVFEQNTLSQTFTSSTNCDSTHIVDVLLLNDTLTTNTINLCQGDSITIGSFTYTINSLILQPSTAANGCDSTHIINIFFINTFQGSDSITICEGDSVTIGNQNIYSDTTFVESINGANSCDTILTYYISTIPSVETQEEILLCEGDTVLVFGQPVFEQNTISQAFIGSNTCDSIHTVDVLLLNDLETTETINLCIGDSITIGNTTYYQDAFFVQNFTAINGCDSLHSITIDFEDAIYLIDTTLLCEDEFVIFFEDTISSSGFFEFTQNPLGQGCDTINQLWVEVYDNPDAITFIDPACLEENNGQIEISNPQANWMYSLDGINYQAEPIFDMLPSGDYQLWVENEYGCMSSSIFEIPNSSIPDFTLQSEVTIPSGFTLEMPVTYSDTNNLQFNWSPAIGLSCINCPFPSLTGAISQTYTLEVTDIFGCSTSQLIEVNLATEGIYIPNAFTPNKDGNNDRFTVYAGPSTPSIELLRIFDKWGEVLYELEDFAPNDESLGWDGTLRGQPMMPGIYVYKCIVMTPNDGLQTLTGDITLYR